MSKEQRMCLRARAMKTKSSTTCQAMMFWAFAFSTSLAGVRAFRFHPEEVELQTFGTTPSAHRHYFDRNGNNNDTNLIGDEGFAEMNEAATAIWTKTPPAHHDSKVGTGKSAAGEELRKDETTKAVVEVAPTRKQMMQNSKLDRAKSMLSGTNDKAKKLKREVTKQLERGPTDFDPAYQIFSAKDIAEMLAQQLKLGGLDAAMQALAKRLQKFSTKSMNVEYHDR
ncbi:unnamed protein product, partial [Amoebophrya sp. A120]|eukprot:GSA120T00011877001.1